MLLVPAMGKIDQRVGKLCMMSSVGHLSWGVSTHHSQAMENCWREPSCLHRHPPPLLLCLWLSSYFHALTTAASDPVLIMCPDSTAKMLSSVSNSMIRCYIYRTHHVGQVRHRRVSMVPCLSLPCSMQPHHNLNSGCLAMEPELLIPVL